MSLHVSVDDEYCERMGCKDDEADETFVNENDAFDDENELKYDKMEDYLE